eukprot:TRINITY_DN27702_c0_g1_i1.p1 TRINITY_DN27702_c0_g1~~TRINITY_DN27702_c0_g1_i1.p1  ORF type:complete len:436 (-),score=76.22 TRINITY_DN27702_c0_g1_i1:106-1413(-)
MRVAVVGAGITGSACAWRVLTGKTKGMEGLAVSVFEMGRGAGGRAGTRHVREFPGLHVNHGAPLFHVPAADSETKPLISALASAGHVAPWQGTFGSLSAKTGAAGSAGASRGELELGAQPFSRYVGVPTMSAVAGGCLQLAKETDGAKLSTHFAVRIKEFRPQRQGSTITGWEIVDKDEKSYGIFDWIVVSGATPALARWRDGFKEEPPVYAAAKASGSTLFPNLIARLDSPLEYEQTHIVSMAWDMSSGCENSKRVRQSLEKLSYSITQVQDDEVLEKVSVQSIGPSHAVVALHSTGAFARKHKKVKGAGSFVSVANNVEGSVDQEATVANELFDALQRLLSCLDASPLPKPAWGPSLHRWGAAFPKPDTAAIGLDKAWVLPDERFLLAGDYLAPPVACVASAMRSGLAAGDALLRIAQGLPVEATKLHVKSAL